MSVECDVSGFYVAQSYIKKKHLFFEGFRFIRYKTLYWGTWRFTAAILPVLSTGPEED